MASEITITAKLAASKAGTSTSNATSSFTIDMTGDQMSHGNPSISTTAAAIDVSPVDTSGGFWLFLRNQDSTNYVLVSVDGGANYKMRVPPGKSWGPCYMEASTSVYLDAQVAACITEQVAVEA